MKITYAVEVATRTPTPEFPTGNPAYFVWVRHGGISPCAFEAAIDSLEALRAHDGIRRAFRLVRITTDILPD